MKLFVLLLLIVLTVSTADIVSYEGFIGDYPVWVEINTTEGEISGEYFYRTVGTPIALLGKISADSIIMTETFETKVTGYWSGLFIPQGGRIFGQWYSSDSSTQQQIHLYRSCANLSELSVNWKLRDLSFADRLIGIYPEGYEDEDGDGDAESFYSSTLTFSRNGIAQYDVWHTRYVWDWEVAYHFDTQLKQTITIIDEFDPRKLDSLTRLLNDDMNVQYEKHITNMIAHSEGESLPIKLIECDSVSVVEVWDKLTFTLYENYFAIQQQGGYFEFPQAFRFMEFNLCIEIPYADLDYFLKPHSPLKRLTELKIEEGIE